ncbi:MAG: hypothetical protein UT32_C0004G0021 [Parcubacteria group bacterium GW2011_GWC2_39_14]|nr:MAG: hypothetical protein UT32_C0004G0021 [Parcubacteria group bacterium GW2011_GWC2_39_14]KKR54865.1 MAG: hypothetical protein UT91_C0008G0021 [Parcubacteria group bacterium GW2011_GWA2_40_23]
MLAQHLKGTLYSAGLNFNTVKRDKQLAYVENYIPACSENTKFQAFF